MFQTEGRIKYYADVRELAIRYLQECDRLTAEEPHLCALLDKPNAHRAVELALHTIPTFGHARNCSEMVLESMHQVFKRWLEKSTHQDSHLTAVERALARDWSGRVASLFNIWQAGTSRERACSELGLRRLLLGEDAVHLSERQHDVSAFKMEFHDAMRDAFRRPVLQMMGRSGHLSLPSARSVRWTVYTHERLKLAAVADLGDVFRRGHHIVAKEYGMRVGYSSESLQVFSAARLVHVDRYEGARRLYAHNQTTRGCILSCPTESEGDLIKEECGGRTMRFFCLEGVVRGPDGRLWAVTAPMTQALSSGTKRVMRADRDKVTVVLLTDAVRRAGAAHVCDERCVSHPRQLRVKHSAGVEEGGMYEVWTREDGYPPHMG